MTIKIEDNISDIVAISLVKEVIEQVDILPRLNGVGFLCASVDC